MDYPFHWLEDATVSLSATTTSARVALLRMPTGRTQLRIFNAGPATVFIRKGLDNTVVATATDLPIPAGVLEVLTLTNSQAAPITHIAGITGASTATLYFSIGTGE